MVSGRNNGIKMAINLKLRAAAASIAAHDAAALSRDSWLGQRNAYRVYARLVRGEREIAQRPGSAAVFLAMRVTFHGERCGLTCRSTAVAHVARSFTDEKALAAIDQLVEELESRAREADNGRADGS